MKVISVLNQKGGSGKTTIATHLARVIYDHKFEVLLIDSDPQGSARDWSAVNEENPITVIGLDRPTIDRDLKAIPGKDFIIIDGAPQASDLAVSAIKASDLILIPVQPSPYDIWATSDLVDLIKQRIEMTDGKLKAAFVISRVITGTRIGNEIREALAEYQLPVLKTYITQRVNYPMSAALGKTIFDLDKKGESSKEITDLYNEINDEYLS